MDSTLKIIGGSDDKGHSAPLPTRVPPDWLRQIDTMLKNLQIPYQNRADFVRDAIARHLEFVEAWSNKDGSILGKIKSMMDLIEEERCQQGFEGVLVNLRERVGYFKQKNAPREAIRCVLKILQYVEDMNEGHWKDTFAGLLRNEYSDLLKNAKKVSLIPIVEEK